MYNSSYSSYGQGSTHTPSPAFSQNGPPHPSTSSQSQNPLYSGSNQFTQAPLSTQNMYGMNQMMPMSSSSMSPHGAMAPMSTSNNMGPSYQTPYNVSSYNPTNNAIPSSASSRQGNFMPAMPTSGTSQPYAMQPQNLTPQTHSRMQPPSSSTNITPSQRASPYGAASHHTPPHSAQNQSHFATPLMSAPDITQLPDQSMMQTRNPQSSSNPPSVGMQTPQTPSFPNGVASASMMAPPLSPDSVGREKERVTTIMAINSELLQELMRITDAVKLETDNKTMEMTKDTTMSDETVAKTKADLLRRVAFNLQYLAAMADGTKKLPAQIPYTTFLTPPSLSTMGDSENKELGAERFSTLHSLYSKLQTLFQGQFNAQAQQPQRTTPQMGNMNLGQQPKQITPRMSNQPIPQQSQPQQHPLQNMAYSQPTNESDMYNMAPANMGTMGQGHHMGAMSDNSRLGS